MIRLRVNSVHMRDRINTIHIIFYCYRYYYFFILVLKRVYVLYRNLYKITKCLKQLDVLKTNNSGVGTKEQKLNIS